MQRRFVAQRAPPPTSILQGEDSAVSFAPAASAPSDQGAAGAPAAATIVAQRAPSPTSTLQGDDSAASTAPAASAPSDRGSATAPAAATNVAQRAPPPTSSTAGLALGPGSFSTPGIYVDIRVGGTMKLCTAVRSSGHMRHDGGNDNHIRKEMIPPGKHRVIAFLRLQAEHKIAVTRRACQVSGAAESTRRVAIV